MTEFATPDFTNFYIAAGALVITNVGTIGTILFYGMKALWWVSKLDSRVEANTKDVNAAHKAIRDIKSGDCE